MQTEPHSSTDRVVASTGSQWVEFKTDRLRDNTNRAELRQGDDDGLVHNHDWAVSGK